MADVLQGFGEDADFKKACRAIGKYMQVEMINPELAVQSARNYGMLRKNGHELLHNDSDFDGYEKYLGLKVIHP